MARKKAALARRLAATVSIAMLVLAPVSASAAERQNPWSLWVEDLGDREYWYEVPFLAIVSIGPMVAITPIWLVQLAYDAAKGES